MGFLSTAAPVQAGGHSPTDTRLRGCWLHVVQVGTLGFALASIILFFMMLPSVFLYLETPCANGSCPLTPLQVQSLRALGLTPTDYAIFFMSQLFISAIPSLIVAAIIFWRRSDDWLALLLALQLVNPTDGILGAAGIWQTPASILHIIFITMFYLTFTLFPSGRFVPRWEWWVVIAWTIFYVVQFFVSQDAFPDWLLGPLYLVFYVNLLFCQIYRYWRVSSPVERQQTKWVVLGLVVALLANIAYWQSDAFIPALNQPDSLYAPLLYPVYQLITISIPLSFGIAILRYRLWDIDAIINKALVYGLLTALLGTLYVGLVIGLEYLVGLFAKQTADPLVLVISTLAIAALFQPARRRIQALIDRRFYRKKYDAEEALAAFSATLRDQVDLEQVHERLLTVVQETMQPAYVSLWLRKPDLTGRTRGVKEA